MTLRDLIKKANAAYPDDHILRNFDERKDCLTKNGTGDTLGRFICGELCDTFDPAATAEAQLAEAERVIGVACDEIGRVLAALRPAVPDTGGQPISRRAYANLKSKLTRAHKTGDPAVVARVARAALEIFATSIFPDDWRIWQNALDEANHKLLLAGKTPVT